MRVGNCIATTTTAETTRLVAHDYVEKEVASYEAEHVGAPDKHKDTRFRNI